jgi:hypothetical protein
MSNEVVPPDAATDTTEVRPDVGPVETPEPSAVEPDVGVTDVIPDAAEDAETFPRDYVEKLRKESAGYRDKAKTTETRAEELSARLHSALVAATGRLADPTDLAYDPAHLDGTEALTAAIDALTEAKPHLKARKVNGDVGQGQRGTVDEPFSLLNALKRT